MLKSKRKEKEIFKEGIYKKEKEKKEEMKKRVYMYERLND